MADDTDPFNFNMGNLAQEWNTALGDPAVRAALLQFGISALQPPQFGDTTGSLFGRALGHAGEAIDRRTEQERKQFEAESKADVAEARMRSAETASQRAADRATYEQGTLEHKRQQTLLQDQVRRQQAQIKASHEYDAYRDRTEKRNRDIMLPRGQPPEPIMSRDEYYEKFHPQVLQDIRSASSGAQQEPQAGFVKDGYRYIGNVSGKGAGDPANWVPVQ
jgi:hypothetical protein